MLADEEMADYLAEMEALAFEEMMADELEAGGTLVSKCINNSESRWFSSRIHRTRIVVETVLEKMAMQIIFIMTMVKHPKERLIRNGIPKTNFGTEKTDHPKKRLVKYASYGWERRWIARCEELVLHKFGKSRLVRVFMARPKPSTILCKPVSERYNARLQRWLGHCTPKILSRLSSLLCTQKRANQPH